LSVTSVHIPYKEKLEPIVLPLENVAIARGLDESKWKYYKVKYIEPIFLEVTTSTITAGSSEDLDLSDLELHKNEFAQIRFSIETTGFELEIWLPAATSKYTTKNKKLRVQKWVTDTYPNLTELTYAEDVTPKVTVYNESGSDGAATIRFYGFRYVLEPLPARPEKFTVVYVETVASTER